VRVVVGYMVTAVVATTVVEGRMVVDVVIDVE